MVQSIPFTHYLEYVAEAKAIRRRLGPGTAGAATVQQGLVELADLAVRALAETNDVVEGLAALVMALHPEVQRTPRARRKTSRARG